MAIQKRLKEIQNRKIEIRNAIQNNADIDLDATKQELEKLEVETRSLNEKLEIANGINVGNIGAEVIETPKAEKRTETQDIYSTVEYRQAFMNHITYRQAFMNHITKGTKIPAEYRDNAVTKTTDVGALIPSNVLNKIIEKIEATGMIMNHITKGTKIPAEYRDNAVTKTTDVGALIPSNVLNKIIEKIEATGMILPLVTRTAVRGGVTIPTSSIKPVAKWVAEGVGSLNKIIEKIEATGMILPLVTRTAVRGGVTIPTSSIKPVAKWVAEGVGSDKQKKDTTGTITFSYYKLRCAVAVTLETETMALSAFESVLISNIVEAMVKALEQAIISGTGSGCPKGILTETPNDGQEVTGEISYKLLCDAEAALPLEYEDGAVYVMSKKSFMAYVAMVDSNGQPIARVTHGINGRPERTLLGRTVILCNYVPTDVHAFLFNFSDYVLNTNYQMGLKKYEDNETDDLVTKAIMIACNYVPTDVHAFLFNFSDYVLNTNYQMGLKKYEDNETDDLVTKAIMIADGKVIVKDSLVIVKKG